MRKLRRLNCIVLVEDSIKVLKGIGDKLVCWVLELTGNYVKWIKEILKR